MGVGGQRHVPAALPPGKGYVRYFIVGWVGPRAGLDEYENLDPIGVRSHGRPACRESKCALIGWTNEGGQVAAHSTHINYNT
jgi:hypothetical protein